MSLWDDFYRDAIFHGSSISEAIEYADCMVEKSKEDNPILGQGAAAMKRKLKDLLKLRVRFSPNNPHWARMEYFSKYNRKTGLVLVDEKIFNLGLGFSLVKREYNSSILGD